LTLIAALDGDDLLGTVALSQAGDISEMALSPALDRKHARRVRRSLLESAGALGRECGARAMNLFLPADDDHRDLSSLGYREIEAPGATIRVVDFLALLAPIARSRRPAIPMDDTIRFRITITDRPADSCDRELFVTSDAGGIEVAAWNQASSPAEHYAVTLSSRSLSEILFGLRDFDLPPSSFLTPRRREAVLATLAALCLDAGWFTPLGDHR
jgi:hypothetical protein